MKKNEASRTAQGAALYRAMESKRPEHDRACHDPMAKYFLSPINRRVAASGILTRAALRQFDRMGLSGLYGGVVARTRYIDDFLEGRIKEGACQVVFLGAGFDTRAYRIEEMRRDVRVFEVDQPATQSAKVKRLSKLLGALPDHVRYVSLDLQREDLRKVMYENGYDSQLKTVFVWEGVTMYLAAPAVDDALGFIADNSSRGSSVIFDFAFESVIGGTSRIEGAEEWRAFLERIGEPATFGIERDDIVAFLEPRGFSGVMVISYRELGEAFFNARGRHQQVSEFMAIAHATVATGSQDAV